MSGRAPTGVRAAAALDVLARAAPAGARSRTRRRTTRAAGVRRLACSAILFGTLGACARSPNVPTVQYVQAFPEPEPVPPEIQESLRNTGSSPSEPAGALPALGLDTDAGSPAPPTGPTRRAALPMPRTSAPPPTAGRSSVAAVHTSPQQVVADATQRAVQAPSASDTVNAIVQYAFEVGTLYQVYAAPMRVTDIVLEPGERILGSPAAGDVVRWILALGQSMDHGTPQTHVYLKPTRPELTTNLAINTDRRTYLLELHSYADTYMAAVMWHYPQEEMARLALRASDAAAKERSTSPVVSLDALNFNYAIDVVHGSPAWTPTQVFDDGRRTFIHFPPAMLVREAPALFVLRDSQTELVNYRQKGDFYVVDRLVDAAEMRVGQKDPDIVRVRRLEPRR